MTEVYLSRIILAVDFTNNDNVFATLKKLGAKSFIVTLESYTKKDYIIESIQDEEFEEYDRAFLSTEINGMVENITVPIDEKTVAGDILKLGIESFQLEVSETYIISCMINMRG